MIKRYKIKRGILEHVKLYINLFDKINNIIMGEDEFYILSIL